MAMQIGGMEVLMSGSALLERNEDLFVDDGNGTTLRMSWDQPGQNSSTGGNYANLIAQLPIQPPSSDYIGEFGSGLEAEPKMKMVRYHVQRIGTGKLVTYTVFLQDR